MRALPHRVRRMTMTACFAALLAIAAALTLAPPARAVPGDELWGTNWNRAGANLPVLATTEFGGQLVVGGEFGFVGTVAASRVAIFNGTSWAPLGDGFNDAVRALCVYNGELYAGGDFTASGVTPLSGLARWNGSAWVAVGGGVNGYVEALAVYGSALIVGGWFTEAGGATAVSGIASWNGTSWGTLAGGLSNEGFVLSAAVFSGSLYVCGHFESAGPISANNIARWNGTAWSALGNGLTDEDGTHFEAEGTHLLVWSSRLVVTGTFAEAGGVERPNFATWNGTTWGTVGPDPAMFASGAAALGEHAGNLIVHDAQPFAITSRWNGTFWSSLINTGGAVFAMGPYGADLVVGGSFDNINGTQAERLARYNGATWSAFATGDGASPGLDAFFEWNGQLYAGGSGTRFGQLGGTLVAGWDGDSWNAMGSGITPGPGRHVSAFENDGGVLVAGGSFAQAGGGAVSNYARWNGAAWSAMGSGITGVQAMQVVRGAIYAYGTAPGTAVVRWNGSSWVSIGSVNDIVWDLDEYNGKLVAAGTFSSIGGATVRGLATWDSLSGTWSAIGASALNNSVFAMVVDGNDLYIGGTFTTVAGNAVNRVAQWNGASWSSVGTGVGNRVFDMLLYDDDLFVTGEFVTAGGSPANYIARWNGSAWSALGSGLNARGLALGVYDDELFVGGDFTIAGGRYSSGIATWAEPGNVSVSDAPAAAPGLALSARPSPFHGSTTLAWRLAQPAHVRLRVFDLSGRAIATLADRRFAAGQHAATWDGRDAAGRTVAPGVYLCRAEAGDHAQTLRVVRVR